MYNFEDIKLKIYGDLEEVIQEIKTSHNSDLWLLDTIELGNATSVSY